MEDPGLNKNGTVAFVAKERLSPMYKVGLIILSAIYLILVVAAVLAGFGTLEAGAAEDASFRSGYITGQIGCCLTFPVVLALIAGAIVARIRGSDLKITMLKTAFWLMVVMVPGALLWLLGNVGRVVSSMTP